MSLTCSVNMCLQGPSEIMVNIDRKTGLILKFIRLIPALIHVDTEVQCDTEIYKADTEVYKSGKIYTMFIRSMLNFIELLWSLHRWLWNLSWFIHSDSEILQAVTYVQSDTEDYAGENWSLCRVLHKVIYLLKLAQCNTEIYAAIQWNL